jgi:hypothetical protein
LGGTAPQHVDGNRFHIGNLRANEIEEDATQRAFAAAVGHHHAAVRFCFKRLSDEGVRSLQAKRTDGAPDGLLWKTLRYILDGNALCSSVKHAQKTAMVL